ncbi:glycosyltransferase family 1 protein [Robertmurraya yapensis]|uniref:Glycosyltransferase family 1 protein n=1 Tax=Bacillus yapensis TaxID=2492960 RepID=A0A3S0RU94_9BACI|nr:glycosyltransferase family 4 protein [Bacillus yapensis]RTR36411.1 glycosyltransferase family 1 protein [Bacillus yapensis]TKT05915.1 glycosyltransferase [Bacillus yapensis]
MKRIKVLHVCPSLDKGGLEEVIYNLVKNSNDNEYDVSVAYFNGGLVSDRLEEKGYTCYKLSGAGKIDKIKEFMKVIKENEIDIVQAHFCFSGILAAKLSGVKIIETVHNTYVGFINPTGKLKYSLYLNMVDCIVSVSNEVSRFNFKNFSIGNKSKCKVITNSIDPERLNPSDKSVEKIKEEFGIPTNKRVISTLSRIDSQKGLEYFIEAAKKLNTEYDDLVFLIPGTGDEKYAEKLKESIINDNNIRFIGHVTKVNQLYKIMDIFVISSLWEGGPLTLLEAMAYGKAVIATPVGITPEVIENGINGYLVNVEDVDDLYEKIKDLLDNNKRSLRLGQQAKKDFEDKFSNEIMISNYKNLYRTLIKG